MEPIKLKILKRHYTEADDDELIVPLKKRNKEKGEKENKNSESKNSTVSSGSSKKSSKILKNSPVPNTRAISKTVKSKHSSSDDEIDSVFDEMLVQLNKSGIKIADSSRISSSEKKEHSVKQKSVDKCDSDSKKSKSKKVLLKEFNDVDSSPKQKKSKRNSEQKIPELEKPTESLILNFKRTPKKKVDLDSFETPKKEESVITPRRSSRRKSFYLSETFNFDAEVTPSKKKKKETPSSIRGSDKTPSRKSSTKKLETIEAKTPTSKIKVQEPRTPLEKARLSLHVSTVPECLPCREKEYTNILNFLENKLCDGIGGCMYISGVPGTGKTATVTQVIRHLQDCAKEGKVPDFNYIEINGMRLSDPRQAYVQLWQKLFEKKDKITPDRAQQLLDDWFSKGEKRKQRKTTVLLVDELDLICTKKQDVVYNLLDWPGRTLSRLVVLTIANTMDMPERLFKGRVTSRMGLTRLTFMPYTHKQLEEIVLARLQGLNAFVTDAVRLVTRKVAAVSGDARRALDICRRATELPLPDETVKISHIEQAIKEMTNSNIVKVIRNCGEMEKLFLRSLSDVSSRTNIDETDLREVIDQLSAVCVLEGISRPSISSVLSISNRLKCCRLIFSNQSSSGILQRLTLNVTHDDIHYALRQ